MKFPKLNAAIGRPRPPRSPDPVKPTVVLQPTVYREMQAGINLIAEAIRPTLGPFPRHVAIERPLRTDAPEFLDDASVIARRIIQVSPRTRDVGAMLLRKSLWQMHEDVGDGSATMGVLFQRIFNEGVRYITEFGCNPMLLRNGFIKGMKAVIQELRGQATPLAGRQEIARIALGMSQGDTELAGFLGEIFDIVGKDGLIVVEKGNRPGLEREYIEGTYWHISGWFSRLFINEPKEKRVTYEDAALLITDMELKEPLHLVPVLECCVKAGIQKLVIVAGDISGPCIGLLEQNKQARTIEAMAVRTPRIGDIQRVASMEDIATLTGGRPFYKAASQNFDDFQVEDLGHARRAWATESLFGIYGGKGDVRKIRQRIAHVRSLLQTAELDSDKELLQARLGRLSGGTAILRTGGYTETEIESRQEIARRAVTGLRLALEDGVVPGGGVALLGCQACLDNLPADNEDETLAYRILGRALEEPMRVIAHNSGYSEDVILDRVQSAPPGFGFDARQKMIVDLREQSLLDAVRVLVKALEVAVSGAAMALTTDVIVHHSLPKESLEP
jgi:chaperonin GroEL